MTYVPRSRERRREPRLRLIACENDICINWNAGPERKALDRWLAHLRDVTSCMVVEIWDSKDAWIGINGEIRFAVRKKTGQIHRATRLGIDKNPICDIKRWK